MEITNNKKIIAKVLVWIGIIIILLFIIGMIYGMITRNGKFVVAMIIGLTIVSLLYRWGIMAFRKLYYTENKEIDEENLILKNSNINTKNI